VCLPHPYPHHFYLRHSPTLHAVSGGFRVFCHSVVY
jgi:hypothetical protein